MTISVFNMKANGKEIIFGRPYLNENKELTFQYCSEFVKFPQAQFVLNETHNSIELRNQNSKKKVYLLLKGNEVFFKEAVGKKDEILELLRDYTKRLRSGEEKVYVVKTNNKQYPYYFTTETIWNFGDQSCKFVQGFMYFINQHLKSMNNPVVFEDFDYMQQRFGEHFRETGFEKFQADQVNGMELKVISLKNFIELLK